MSSRRTLQSVRTAVIGTGRMGQRHAQIVKGLGLDLIGIYDEKPEAREGARQALGLEESQAFDRLEPLLEQRPECVIVATTAPTHAKLACAAAEAGARYILCEKPMAGSLAECDEMIAVCKKRGARLAVNHQMRFMELYTEPKRLLASDEHGGLCSMVVLGGNFGLAMNGSHYFEAFRFLSGEPPAAVSAWLSEERVLNPRGPQFEDRAGEVRITSASGKRFYLNASADQGHGMRSVYSSRYGQIDVDELTGRIVAVTREPQYRDLPLVRYGMPAVMSTMDIPAVDALSPSRAVLRALLGDENPPSGEDGRLVVETLVAAHVSAERGGTAIQIGDPGIPRDRVFPWA